MSWIDSHTHLDHDYPFSIEQYLSNARASGVIAFITIGTTPGKLRPLLALAEKEPDVYFSVGIHPHEAKDFNDDIAREMNELRQHKKCVGVGEIGLDYYYQHSLRDSQKLALSKQLELALLWEKPVIIHARDAEADLTEVLKNYVAEQPKTPGVIHCFSGTQNFADTCLNLGFYLSFSGIVTFKNADALRDVVRKTPLERILLETDSPFLAPVPYRGKPNQSAYIVETAKVIAQLKCVKITELSKATVANTLKLFNI